MNRSETDVEFEKRWTFETCKCVAAWMGNDDFFFCHWYAESENAIIESLSEAGADQYMITMATEVGIPKIDLDRMTVLMGKIK